MTKEQFIKQLNSALYKLPKSERQDILQDYEEHFGIGIEEGKTEEQIASSLGSPNQIAKELLASYHLEKAEAATTAGNIFRAVWAAVGLGFFNLVIVLGPFIALIGVIMSGWITGAVFTLTPLLVLANTVINPGTTELYDLFFSLALCGLGLFMLIGMFFVTKGVNKGFIRYLKFNVSLVKGGLKHDED